MAGVIEGQIKETLTCKICYQVLDNPKTLPCMHTYCCGCLEKLMTKESEGNTLKCPECRQEHVLPENGVHGLKVSFTTKTLAEILKAGDAEKSPYCDSCKVKRNVDINAVVKCLECNKNLCKSCLDSHDEFTNGHTTVDLTGDQSQDMQRALETVKDRTIYCTKHNIPLQIYCKVDKCVVCATCYAVRHSGHECMDIHEAAEDTIKHIKELLKRGDNIIKHYETAMRETHKTKNSVEAQMNKTVSELTNDMNDAIQHIRDAYTTNIKRIQEKRETHTKQSIAHLGHLELQKTLIESTMGQLCTARDYAHNVELANMAPDVASKLKQWKDAPDCAFDTDVNLKVNVRKGELFDDRIVFTSLDEGRNSDPGVHIDPTPTTPAARPARRVEPKKTKRKQALCVQCADGTIGVYRMECGHLYCYSCKDYLAKDPTVKNCVKCTKGPQRDTPDDNVKEEDKCIVCMEKKLKPKVLDKCGHSFCTVCIDKWLEERPQCPVCGVSYGKRKGDQPKGTMSTRNVVYPSLPGYEGCGHIEISYNIPDGVQEDIHPSPGKYYRGVYWTAYLPDNKEGNEIAGLLRKAFDARLIFTIGHSRTRGTDDVVTWNDIHHKTKIHGGPSHFGYPDPDYLTRVREELAAKGIK